MELEKEVALMNENDLKNLIEKEWDNCHLEYLEIARKEYIKRGFKNVTTQSEEDIPKNENVKRYPALRTIISTYTAFAWIGGISLGAIALFGFLKSDLPIYYSIASLIIGVLIFISLLGAAETISLFIDIEENTRKQSE